VRAELLSYGRDPRKTLCGALELKPLVESFEGTQCLLNALLECGVFELHLYNALIDTAHAEVTAFHT
jgi:hypothetical protein